MQSTFSFRHEMFSLASVALLRPTDATWAKFCSQTLGASLQARSCGRPALRPTDQASEQICSQSRGASRSSCTRPLCLVLACFPRWPKPVILPHRGTPWPWRRLSLAPPAWQHPQLRPLQVATSPTHPGQPPLRHHRRIWRQHRSHPMAAGASKTSLRRGRPAPLLPHGLQLAHARPALVSHPRLRHHHPCRRPS